MSSKDLSRRGNIVQKTYLRPTIHFKRLFKTRKYYWRTYQDKGYFQKTFQERKISSKSLLRPIELFKRLIKTRSILHKTHRDMNYCYSKDFLGWGDVIENFLKTRKFRRRILWNGRFSSKKLSRWWIFFETIVMSDSYFGRMFKQNNENHIN